MSATTSEPDGAGGERFEARTGDGVRLSLRRFRPPPGAPRRGALLCTHAMMASSGYQTRFARHLAAAGLDTVLLDFRGHGKSVPPRAGAGPGPAGDWCFDDYVRHDIPAAITATADVTGVTPERLAYLGHSLGGLAGVAAFGTGEAPAPRRLVLVAVNVWTRISGIRAATSALFGLSARLFGKAPVRALGAGTDDEPRSYVAQFRSWTARGGFFSRDGGTDYAAAAARITAPVLAVVGDGDWLCRAADAREFLDNLASPRTIRCVGPLRGDALAPDHFQLLTRQELTPLWTEIAEFCGDGS